MTPTPARAGPRRCDLPLAPNIVATSFKSFASVVSRMALAGPREEIWQALLFYEQIHRRPPLLLRLLLPLPLRAEGSKWSVGEEVVCHYRGGHLLKRLTRIETGRCYEFDVVEQSFKFGRGITLLGGGYTLIELAGERTEIAVVTRYTSPHRPRWLCERIEGFVCHTFHRHILNGIRDNYSSL